MSYPPFLLPLALLFWGWQSHAPLAAALILTLVAAAGRSPWRWAMAAAQYHRMGDLTAVLFLGAVGYFVAMGGDTLPVYALLRWLPAIFAPLLLAQLYSTGGLLPLSAVFYSIRRYGGAGPARTLDFRLPYAFFCALAAGSGNAGDGAYFAGVAGLVLWTVWRNRPRRPPDAVWLLWFVLAALLGYNGQLGLHTLQGNLEEWAVDWLSDMETDPFRAHTAIGDVGDLKLSGRIVMRVEIARPLPRALLLKEMSYDRYVGQNWLASKAPFEPYTAPVQDASAHLTVRRTLSQRSVLLPLPGGLRGLETPSEADLRHNRLGALKWLDAPPVLRYGAAYQPDDLDQTPPTAEDSRLPNDAAMLLEPLVRQLGLRSTTPERAVAALAEWFARDFGYSLYLGKQGDSRDALKDFLYRRKAGHCEYFATATALLLRAAGVPARFAVGYSVQEYSPAEKLYVVRQRHAHAWTEAYVANAWRVLDNTPSRWAQDEAQTDPWWQSAADWWSRWSTAFKTWRWERAQQPQEQGFPLWGWLVLPLSLWLGRRLYRSRQRTADRPLATTPSVDAAPPDAEYVRLEQSLLAAGHPQRLPGETPLRWLRRLGLSGYDEDVRAYYRRRYGHPGNRQGKARQG